MSRSPTSTPSAPDAGMVSLYVPAGNVIVAPAPLVRFACITAARSVQVPVSVWQVPGMVRSSGLSRLLSTRNVTAIAHGALNRIAANAAEAASALDTWLSQSMCPPRQRLDSADRSRTLSDPFAPTSRRRFCELKPPSRSLRAVAPDCNGNAHFPPLGTTEAEGQGHHFAKRGVARAGPKKGPRPEKRRQWGAKWSGLVSCLTWRVAMATARTFRTPSSAAKVQRA